MVLIPRLGYDILCKRGLIVCVFVQAERLELSQPRSLLPKSSVSTIPPRLLCTIFVGGDLTNSLVGQSRL